jgi:ribosome-binding ATPase YchF (GTP1/OBG family)
MKIAIVGIPDFPLGKKKLADQRLEKLIEVLNPPKVTAISIEAMSEENLKNADAIICLKDKKLDLIIADLEFLEEKLNEDPTLKDIFEKAKTILEQDKLLSEDADENIKSSLKDYPLVTLKPVLLVENEDKDFAAMLDKIYSAEGMICFYTANEKELRAWSIPKGTTAYEAAGKVHSDIQRGFIKAEVVKVADLLQYGHINELKSRDLINLKDKEYIVEDGDLIKFRFNV